MRRIIGLVVMALATAGAAQAQWALQKSNTTAGLRGIHSLGNGVAWASGTNGTVLRTTDDGATWQKCAVPPGAASLDFRAIQGFNERAAMVMSSGPGSQSRLYKTIDSCKTWTLIYTNPDPSGFWDAYRLGPDQGSGADTDQGLLLGDPVHGHFPLWVIDIDQTNFEATPLGHRPDSKKDEAAFAASNSSLFIEWTYGMFWIATGGKNGARVIRHEMHGHNFQFEYGTYPAAKVPIAHGNDSSGIFALAFRPEPKIPLKPLTFRVGIAVGGDYTKPDDSTATAAYTLDGGKSWRAAKTMPGGYRSSVAYDEAAKAWITVGPNGTDISTDDGMNWSAVKPNVALGESTDADRNWNAISLPFVVGPHGRIGKLDSAALPK